MTKKEMIKTIQDLEINLWRTLQEDKTTFGEDHSITHSTRSEWSTVYAITERLGITRLQVTR
jgi:hypothetical protein